ncbi:MAG: hypothetical protein HG428_000660 [Bacteroidia bacterium]|nr:hypothetical protein [Bacteroidia bacterium]
MLHGMVETVKSRLYLYTLRANLADRRPQNANRPYAHSFCCCPLRWIFNQIPTGLRDDS